MYNCKKMIAFVFLFALFSSAVGFSFGQKGSAAINVRGEMTALKVRDVGYFFATFLCFVWIACFVLDQHHLICSCLAFFM